MIVPTLQTKRLILERLTSKFCTAQYVNWLNDPKVNYFLESGGDYTIDKLQDYISETEQKEILFWAITTKINSKHIGNIKIDPVSQRHTRGEYGIMMGDINEWGKGYAREASQAVIDFCFGVLKLRKITLGVIEENREAVKLYEKLGFVTEGIYKDHSFHHGKFYNTMRMAVFNPEVYL